MVALPAWAVLKSFWSVNRDRECNPVNNGVTSSECSSVAQNSWDFTAYTVAFAKGVWRKNTYNGSTSNALVPDSLTDLGGGACFNDARVQVALLGRH